MTTAEALADRLMSEGGAIIRFRAARDILGWPEDRLAPLRAALYENPVTQKWLQTLSRETHFNGVHGSKDSCIENALQKLVQLGCRAGDPELDDVVGPIPDWLDVASNARMPSPFITFKETLIAGHLANAGYGDHGEVSSRLRARLDTVHAHAITGDTDIFRPRSDYGKLPGAFEGRGVIRDDLYNNGNLKLPWIHDVLGWSDASMKVDQGMLDDILDFILSDDYQALPWGYGILMVDKRRFLAMGWSIKLQKPGPELIRRRQAGSFLWQLSILSSFQRVRESTWFTNSLEHLDQFRKSDGTWQFPPDYLNEKTHQYMVGGGHMGLGENRRKKNWRWLESTFWRLYFGRQTS